jgi:antitoxin component YwqK of YwqJK toxin-antitoxin module
MTDLNIAEIPFEGGAIRYRYARKLSDDGRRWIREGLFQAFHENGRLASEGSYHEGREDGPWQDFHDNGQLAAQGSFSAGVETGQWSYWDRAGNACLSGSE